MVARGALAPTGPADLRRQRRLETLVADLGRGIDAAREIWANWSEGERFGQDHPGKSAGQYIDSLGLRLTLAEAMAALPDASSREIGEVAGVSHTTVQRERSGGTNVPPRDAPTHVVGADGKHYPAKATVPFRPRLDPVGYFDKPTVVREVTAQIIEEAPPIEPPNTETWDALIAVMDVIEALSSSDAPYVAATVPHRRRAATAKKLRKLGTYLGRIAWALESEGEPE